MLRMESRDRQFRWWLGALVCGMVLLGVTRAYYGLVFLPRYHGDAVATARQVIDFEGWWTFVRSLPGLMLHAATALCFVTCLLLLILRRRA